MAEKHLTNNEKEERLKQQRENYKRQDASYYANDLYDRIINDKMPKPIPTGFRQLDIALGGGLRPTDVSYIGAGSSLGKTTFVLQIGDQMAQNGQDVLFFSLEQSRDIIIAKSVSRLSYLNNDKKWGFSLSAKNVLDTYSADFYYTPEEREQSEEVKRKAFETYSTFADEHIHIFQNTQHLSVSSIDKIVEEHINIYQRKPVVLIDYLQVLRPDPDEKAGFKTDKQLVDEKVYALKHIAVKYDIPILCISSIKREGYNIKMSMDSWKASGEIEYSADCLLGLQLKGVGEQGFDEQRAKGKEREVELVILKNRLGGIGLTLPFHYNAIFNYFEEDEIVNDDGVIKNVEHRTRFEPVTDGTPFADNDEDFNNLKPFQTYINPYDMIITEEGE